jgi:hypothetical protein
VLRYHLQVDTWAVKADGFRLDLRAYNVVITETGKPLEAIWPKVLERLDRFRAKGVWNPYGPEIFQPFAFITLVDTEAEQRDVDIRNARYIGEHHASHDMRVAALCRALDLLVVPLRHEVIE